MLLHHQRPTLFPAEREMKLRGKQRQATVREEFQLKEHLSRGFPRRSAALDVILHSTAAFPVIALWSSCRDVPKNTNLIRLGREAFLTAGGPGGGVYYSKALDLHLGLENRQLPHWRNRSLKSRFDIFFFLSNGPS
ncbi:hypothetical protein NHX12_025073 [Muraenolepis orangiensis]|uniref:Uncharacterized protein n=1 Tax=Muraenolepis orangiensis TaxID=630683 RepID=A0A9Q0IRX4_9TELE|nr:hypothetical protein NHX12_025073 [Muraenolepis orangiensis]